MNFGYYLGIRERISSAEDGSIFVVSDFSDIASSSTVRQCLKRMCDAGELFRVIEGVYQKPEYSSLLQEYIVPDPDAVAKAIARKYNWTIAPSGNTALNLLGLSAQVPAKWVYVSTGSSKSFVWGNTRLTFVHENPQDLAGLSFIPALVVQALKALGQERVIARVKEILSYRLSEKDKERCLREAVNVTEWIYEVIQEICNTD